MTISQIPNQQAMAEDSEVRWCQSDAPGSIEEIAAIQLLQQPSKRAVNRNRAYAGCVNFAAVRARFRKGDDRFPPTFCTLKAFNPCDTP